MFDLVIFLVVAVLVLILVHVAMSFLPIPATYRTPIWLVVAVILILFLLGHLLGWGPRMSLR
jgi:hypothetical protein